MNLCPKKLIQTYRWIFFPQCFLWLVCCWFVNWWVFAYYYFICGNMLLSYFIWKNISLVVLHHRPFYQLCNTLILRWNENLNKDGWKIGWELLWELPQLWSQNFIYIFHSFIALFNHEIGNFQLDFCGYIAGIFVEIFFFGGKCGKCVILWRSGDSFFLVENLHFLKLKALCRIFWFCLSLWSFFFDRALNVFYCWNIALKALTLFNYFFLINHHGHIMAWLFF